MKRKAKSRSTQTAASIASFSFFSLFLSLSFLSLSLSLSLSLYLFICLSLSLTPSIFQNSFRETNIGIVFWCRKRKGAWIALTIRLLFAARSHWKTRCIFEQLRSLLSLRIYRDCFVKNALRSVMISLILFIHIKFFHPSYHGKIQHAAGIGSFSSWLSIFFQWIFIQNLRSSFITF